MYEGNYSQLVELNGGGRLTDAVQLEAKTTQGSLKS